MKIKIPFLKKYENEKDVELDFSSASLKETSDNSLIQTLRVTFANLRMARAVTQGKGSVRGGGRKPYRQKGTGRARQGSIRNPHFVGGGVAHGPRIRNWTLKIPRKVSKNVFCYLLHKKITENKAFVINDEKYFSVPSVKKFVELLEKQTYKNITIVAAQNSMLSKSTRNLDYVSVKSIFSFGPFDILKSDIIIFSNLVIPSLQKRL
ncbi:50S ribosomal protein L4 [Patescibacteria group bacterium]|nr:50S ribosomal protein L4 [Patescibacteria group bacterium]